MERWNAIRDEYVRHVWQAEEDEADEAIVEPSWYADNGTPITEDAGEDMCYVRTEIRQPATFDEMLSLFLTLCPQGQMGEDEDGQLVFNTNMSQTADGQLQAMPEPD